VQYYKNKESVKKALKRVLLNMRCPDGDLGCEECKFGPDTCADLQKLITKLSDNK
jgi:hypothetical protein